jgi:hypothetical protein
VRCRVYVGHIRKCCHLFWFILCVLYILSEMYSVCSLLWRYTSCDCYLLYLPISPSLHSDDHTLNNIMTHILRTPCNMEYILGTYCPYFLLPAPGLHRLCQIDVQLYIVIGHMTWYCLIFVAAWFLHDEILDIQSVVEETHMNVIEVLGFLTSSIIQYSKNQKTQRFGNLTCFRPQLRKGRHLFCGAP